MDSFTPVSGLEKHLVLKASWSNSPLSGAFELLPHCNLKCRMCYMTASAEKYKFPSDLQPLHFWLSQAEQLKEEGTLFLLLTGGEPFLYPQFNDLYLRLCEMGFVITINTNGTLITKERVSILARHIPRRVNVTLYGTCKETYKKVTGSETAFENTLNGIINLKAAGIPVKLNVSLIPENVSELEAFHKIAEKLEIPIEINTYMYPATRESDDIYHDENRLSPEEAAKADLLNDKLTLSREAFLQFLKNASACYMEKENKSQGTLLEPLPCRAAKSSFWIDWRGNLAPCVFLNRYQVNLCNQSFSKGWEELIRMREEIYMPVTCSDCRMRPFCKVCGAAVFHENPGESIIPDYLCTMTKEKLRLAHESYVKEMMLNE